MNRNGELLSTFLEDAEDILQGLFDTLMVIESEPGNEEKLNELFRLVHTLKGAAALIELDEISNYAHEIETVLDAVRRGELRIDEDLNDIIFSSFNLLKTLIEDVKNQSDVDRSEKISNVVQLLRIVSSGNAGGGDVGVNAGKRSSPPDRHVNAGGRSGVSSSRDGEPEGDEGREGITTSADTGGCDESVSGRDVSSSIYGHHFKLSADESAYIENLLPGNKLYYLKFSIASDAPMPLSRALILYRAMEEEMMIVRSFPAIEFMEEKFDGTVEFIVLGEKGARDVEKLVDIEGIRLEMIKELSVEELQGILSGIQGGGTLEGTGSDPGEEGEPIEEGEGIDSDETVPEAHMKRNVSGTEKITEFSKKLVKDTIRVDVEKLDRLMNLVGELVINRTRNQDIIDRFKAKYGADDDIETLSDSIQDEGRIIYELQESIMASRMVPIGLVFKRFPMFIRNMAKKDGKKVKLLVVGEDTELDKKLVDGISEPLIHLVRNAVDHGIEPAEERIAAGKPEEGTIKISAYHEYNQIVIEIEDDGRGIDTDKVLRKAVEGEAVEADEAKRFTEKEIVNLIFQPGLTTADEVTESSGRGVGMDVVKEKIERMNGVIEIRSIEGTGTKIYIKLPLTLAIIKALLINFNGGIYALPIDDVAEIIKVSTSDFYSDSTGGILLNLRDEIVPLHFIEDLFGLTRKSIKNTYYVIIVKVFDRKEGVIVDGLKGEKEIVIKNLGGAFLDIPGIAGASIMGDGTVVPILDIQELLHKLETGERLSHSSAV